MNNPEVGKKKRFPNIAEIPDCTKAHPITDGMWWLLKVCCLFSYTNVKTMMFIDIKYGCDFLVLTRSNIKTTIRNLRQIGKA